MLPYLGKSSPWFAFLAHLRGLQDADRVGVGPFLRRYSRDQAEYERKLASIPPVVSSEIRFRSTSARGEVICINRLPEQMTGPEARRDVIAAAYLAISRGAKVVGLGALTAPVTGGGLTVARELSSKVVLTNGNALTAAIVRQNVNAAARSLYDSGPREAVVAIVGCTGSVGGAAARLVARAGYRLILIGRNRLRVQREFPDLPSAVYSEQLEDIGRADIVVLLTADPSARVTTGMPRYGSIVIDCSQPANIARADYPEFARYSVRVVEGGIVRIPGYSSTDDFGFTNRTDSFACLAETYVMARSGIRAHSVGRPTPEDALKLESLAMREGIEARPLDLGMAGAPQRDAAVHCA